jgi:hypothetical protein
MVTAWRGVVFQKDDDVAAGQEDGAEVFESSPYGDWRVQHDLQGASALSYE